MASTGPNPRKPLACAMAMAGILPILAAPAGAAAERRVQAVVDDWHLAAAAADEARYFSHLSEDSIFLGTDATERWTKAEFRAFAHPFFAKGKAWTFKAVRRAVTFSADGRTAWFDEDLDTANMGPCRGTGVLTVQGNTWRIRHYSLTVPIPNEAMAEVKARIAAFLAKAAK